MKTAKYVLAIKDIALYYLKFRDYSQKWKLCITLVFRLQKTYYSLQNLDKGIILAWFNCTKMANISVQGKTETLHTENNHVNEIIVAIEPLPV